MVFGEEAKCVVVVVGKLLVRVFLVIPMLGLLEG